MTDRPALFSDGMVQALLAGVKTQTRRLVTSPLARAEPGDRLWPRETWKSGMTPAGPCVAYRSDLGRTYLKAETPKGTFDYAAYPGASWDTWIPDLEAGRKGKWRPRIHMPRWASRLVLTVTEKRIEPLQWISAADAEAEGIVGNTHCAPVSDWVKDASGNVYVDIARRRDTPIEAYRLLWDTLHTTPGERWDDKPLVVAVTFGVERRNINEPRP